MSHNAHFNGRGGQRLMWGEIHWDDVSAQNRRVYSYPIAPKTTIDELLNFFGRNDVEGISLDQKKGTVIIQFRKPSQQSSAISRDKMEFNGKTIRVLPDKTKVKRQVTPPSCANNLKNIHRERKPVLRRSRSRSPSYRRNNDRSPNHHYHHQRHHNHNQPYERPSSRDDYNHPMAVVPSQQGFLQPARFHSSHQPTYPPQPQPEPHVGQFVLSNYAPEYKQADEPPPPNPTTYTPQAQHINQHYASPPTNGMFNPRGPLPNNIDLALKLVCTSQTVAGLNLDQVRDVTNYFQAVLNDRLQHSNGVSETVSFSQQQPVYSSPEPSCQTPVVSQASNHQANTPPAPQASSPAAEEPPDILDDVNIIRRMLHEAGQS